VNDGVEQDLTVARKTEGAENALAKAGTPALDQDAQDDNQQHAGNDPAKQNVIHVESPSSP
jgi:hypothetical protein